MENDIFIDREKDLPDEFYSTKTFTDRLLGFFEDRTEQERAQPFFSFLPFTAPHWPLQAPEKTREKYKGVYDQGPGELRARRLKQLINLGIVSADSEPAPVVGALGHDSEWEQKTEEQKKISAKKMEVRSSFPSFSLS